MTCLRTLILLLAGVRTAYGVQHPIIGLTNPEPEPRVRLCSGVFESSTFIALGGFRAEFQGGPLNDVNVMDTRTGLWRTPVVRGTPPSPQAVGQGLCGGIVGTALVLFDPQAHRSHYLDVENWRWLDSAQCSGQRLFTEEYRRSPSVAVRGSSIFAFVSRSQGYRATPFGRSRLFRLDLAADGGCIGASEWVASSLQERTDEPCSIGGCVGPPHSLPLASPCISHAPPPPSHAATFFGRSTAQSTCTVACAATCSRLSRPTSSPAASSPSFGAT